MTVMFWFLQRFLDGRMDDRKADERLGKTLLVNEIYRSIQGESTWAGLPCVFVRLARCNLPAPS